jgi:hypothetical protein
MRTVGARVNQLRSAFTSSLPVVKDLAEASSANWREALREVFIVLLFSLMPMWLGLILITVLTVSESASAFLYKFASSSDLGILSAALLGPMLYMMFRADEGDDAALPLIARFPSGLWFMTAVIICCVVATVIYCFTYLSVSGSFFDNQGAAIHFVDAHSVATLSWILFAISSCLVLFAATIRNAIMTRAPRMMSDDTAEFVERARQFSASASAEDKTP